MAQDPIKQASQDTAIPVSGVTKPNFRALPVGAADFVSLRRRGQIYVDKTAPIADMVKSGGPLMLLRPRRFGKTLLCNTLEDLFANGVGTKRFDGLAIKPIWEQMEEPTYPVIHLCFTDFAEVEDNFDLETKVRADIQRKLQLISLQCGFQEKGIDFEFHDRHNDTAKGLLNAVLECYHTITGDQFVIIIDEYDALLNQVLDKKDMFEKSVKWYSSFFVALKSMYDKGYLRFLFITGITRYSFTSIFSGFNSAQDLSLDYEYSTMLGFTEDELKSNFMPFLEYGAQVFGESVDEYLEHLHNRYCGYLFSGSKKATTRVYNPWSILNALDRLSQGQAGSLSNFWAQTGSLTGHLFDTIKSRLQGPSKYTAKEELEELLGTDLTADFVMPRSLITAVRNPINPDITSLLSAVRVAMVQTGYYTIKELLDTKDKASHPKYLMTVPNREIEADLRENVLTKLNGFLADELKALDGD